MDALAGLLDGPRARGAFLLRCVMAPPWCVRIRDEAPLALTAITHGRLWLIPDGAGPVPLAAGDVVVNRGPDHYTIADDPASPVTAVIRPGGRCETPDGVALAGEMSLGVRSWGNSRAGTGGPRAGRTGDGTGGEGETVMLTGSYLLEGEVGRRLLRTLPPVVVLRAGEWSSPLVPMLAEEIVRDDPGQEAVLDRLLDLLLIGVLRTWFARPDTRAPGWYRGDADPVVGPALKLLHHRPAHDWTVASLAGAVGVSRAALARRFTELVGEPPMTYLTGWRLALAADLLREPDATLASVARQVGYRTPFALSTAFKRERGCSPRDFRARAGA